jgi:hypothetical protein
VISIILYGRNDSYGYNLHKRAALSLNCMAEVLSDPDDEVLFVDYNTPDDFPTFPEAIQVTPAGTRTGGTQRGASPVEPDQSLGALDQYRHDLCSTPPGRGSLSHRRPAA